MLSLSLLSAISISATLVSPSKKSTASFSLHFPVIMLFLPGEQGSTEIRRPAMKKLPIGIQTFQKIREDNYIYVDKTDLAVQLIDRYQYVFLSRPRRFGKSLFLDTLHNLFEGKKDLFSGLVAENSHDWSKKYPVIKISFGAGDFRSPEMLQTTILETLRDNEKRLDISCEIEAAAAKFSRIIKAAHENYNQPVWLSSLMNMTNRFSTISTSRKWQPLPEKL